MNVERHQELREGHGIVYCVVPRDLAGTLHEPLRRHFRDDPWVEVVVERRGAERRGAADRRDAAAAVEDATPERRRVRNVLGRRIAERRAPAVAVDSAPLPRRARPYAARLVFVERLEPSSERLEDQDTARLLTRIQSGERDLLATLYMRYFDRVYGYLHVIFRSQHDAEDVTQQVFTKVLEALPEYEQRGRPFRAWLFTIARNLALNELRRAGRMGLEADPDTLREDEGGPLDHGAPRAGAALRMGTRRTVRRRADAPRVHARGRMGDRETDAAPSTA